MGWSNFLSRFLRTNWLNLGVGGFALALPDALTSILAEQGSFDLHLVSKGIVVDFSPNTIPTLKSLHGVSRKLSWGSMHDAIGQLQVVLNPRSRITTQN